MIVSINLRGLQGIPELKVDHTCRIDIPIFDFMTTTLGILQLLYESVGVDIGVKGGLSSSLLDDAFLEGILSAMILYIRHISAHLYQLSVRLPTDYFRASVEK